MKRTTILFTRLLSVAILIVLLSTQFTLSAAAASTWNYTALGDSLGKGYFAFTGYVFRYRNYLESDNAVGVNLTNFSQSGWTSSDLLNALRTNESWRSTIRNSRVVTWDIGGKDFLNARDTYKNRTCGGTDNQNCVRSAVASFKSNWSAIIAEILSLRKTGNTVIRTMDFYNPYPNEDRAADTWQNDAGNDFQVFKPYIDDLNNYIATTATSNHIPYAKVYLAFNGACGCEDPSDKGYLSFDGLHPNDTGHKLMADLLRNLGYAPLK